MFLIFNPFTNEDDKAETEEKVVAYLNSEPIYQSELTKEYERLDPTLQQMLDKNSILSQLIDKKVLLEQAKKTGVEADEEIQKIMEQNNLSIEELTENLAIQGFTVEEFKDQLKIFLFLDTEVFSGLEVNEAEVKEYYENNVEQFKIAESVRVRHILISSETRTEEEALEIMNEVEAIFEENNSKFCELVTDYSEDPGSLETCGEYPAFTRDSTFVQEYKDAAFENEVGEAKVVKTQFGYHLIQTLEKIPEKTFTFDEIKTELANSILYEKQKEAFTNYIQGLRTQIEIINCFETPENEMCKQEEDDDNKEKIETTTPISNVVLEPEINEDKESDSLTLFADCLTEKEAKMYGAYWCSHCANQKLMFGDSWQHVTYVECADENDSRVQTPACEEAGISGYPTWKINGKQYPGEQTLETISKLSGCNL